MRRPCLVPNWRRAWRMASVQLAALLALLATAFDYLPELQLYLPEGWVRWLALAIIVARVIQQPTLHQEPRNARRF